MWTCGFIPQATDEMIHGQHYFAGDGTAVLDRTMGKGARG